MEQKSLKKRNLWKCAGYILLVLPFNQYSIYHNISTIGRFSWLEQFASPVLLYFFL